MKIVDLALWFEAEKILIVSDFHIGYEEALNREGLMIPRQQFGLLLDRLDKIFSVVGKVDKIIINGDLKHEFGQISETEWNQTTKLLDYFSSRCNEIVLIKGNHDTILEPIAKRKNLKIVEYYKFGDTLVCHGNKIIDIDAKRIIIGHEHPAVELRKGVRTEKYKCFLFGKFGKSELIVMPSFNLIKEGSDVLREDILSPYIKDIKKFKVMVTENKELLDFGKVENLLE